ncbi:MAG: universal stress protein, partial [Panacibacter sp.]
MSFTFSNILIPVDFSVNTEIAIKKALWLAVSLNPVIYLLHVLTPDVSAAGSYSHGYLFKAPVIQTEYVKFAEIRLQKIKEDIQQVFPQAGVVTKVVAADNIQMKIIEFANSIKPELIVIGKNKNHRWLPFL